MRTLMVAKASAADRLLEIHRRTVRRAPDNPAAGLPNATEAAHIPRPMSVHGQRANVLPSLSGSSALPLLPGSPDEAAP